MERATALARASPWPLAVVELAVASPLPMARPARVVLDSRERCWVSLATTWPIVPSAPSAIAASARARAGESARDEVATSEDREHERRDQGNGTTSLHDCKAV